MKISLVTSCLAGVLLFISNIAHPQDPATAQQTGTQQLNPASNDGQLAGADHYFQTTDFARYLGQPVAMLLDELPYRYSERIGIDEPPGVLHGVHYIFEGGYTINIYVNRLWHTQSFDSNNTHWNNFKGFEQETIASITVQRYGPEPMWYKRSYGRQDR